MALRFPCPHCKKELELVDIIVFEAIRGLSNKNKVIEYERINKALNKLRRKDY